MASKKTVRVSKLTKLKDYNALVLSDVHCPICRSILIEPVSLPCNHDFCLFCFEGTMENTNLVCPLCRLRIGSWLRRARKDNILINGKLWKAIKEGFPIHVKNKLDGVDENLEEKREIIVSYPGEIRNEYEMQKQKEDEEQNKRKEKEIKASEELIKTLTEEDDYQKAVMEEKLKVDEEMAKKLSEELTAKHPSTSKKIIYKKKGPMDKFVKKDNETTNLNPNTFANKEYTCRVLCLDSGTSSNESSVKEFSSKIHKKMQQLQKIVDLESTRDGSDCIESEMRYFKPIDYRSNPPTQRKTPLKVTPQKIPRDASAKVLSPGGLINFCSNILESAFARFSIDMPKTPNASKITSVSSSNSNKETFSGKRTLSSNDFKISDKKLKKDTTTESQDNYNKSPILDHNKRKNLFKNTVKLTKKEVDSPPFYGFDRTKPGNQKNRKNGRSVEDKSYVSKLKKDQEQADLEFAKRLQEEINKSHYTRSSRHLSISKRQKTLDEMIKSPYRVK